MVTYSAPDRPNNTYSNWRDPSTFKVVGTFEIWLVVVSKKNMNRYFGRLPTDPKSKAGPKLWNIGDIFAAPVKPAAGSLREAGGSLRGGDSWLALHQYSSTVEFWLSQKYVQLKVWGPSRPDFQPPAPRACLRLWSTIGICPPPPLPKLAFGGEGGGHMPIVNLAPAWLCALCFQHSCDQHNCDQTHQSWLDNELA